MSERLRHARERGFISASWLGCADCGSEDVRSDSAGYTCRSCNAVYLHLKELVVVRRDDMAGATE